MKTRNTNWDPNSEAAPLCDDCGALSDRGYSMRCKGVAIATVWCFECSDRRNLDTFRRDRHLTSQFVTTAIVKYDRAQRDGDMPTLDAYEGPRHAITMVELSLKRFRASVWPIVRAQVNAERVYKGMRLDQDGITVLAFAMCGRIRIQVERGDTWCSGQGAEKDAEQGFGLHGIGATEQEAMTLWDDAIKLFENGAKLVAAPSVGL